MNSLFRFRRFCLHLEADPVPMALISYEVIAPCGNFPKRIYCNNDEYNRIDGQATGLAKERGEKGPGPRTGN
jgi:hypothetical protein